MNKQFLKYEGLEVLFLHRLFQMGQALNDGVAVGFSVACSGHWQIFRVESEDFSPQALAATSVGYVIFIGWERCGRGAHAGPEKRLSLVRRIYYFSCLDFFLVLSLTFWLNLNLRYCRTTFARKLPTCSVPSERHVVSLVTSSNVEFLDDLHLALGCVYKSWRPLGV